MASTIESAHHRWFRPDRTAVDWDAEGFAAFLLRFALSSLTYPLGNLSEHGLRRTGENSFCIWLEFHHPQVSYAALELAAYQCRTAASGRSNGAELQRQMERFWVFSSPRHPGLQGEVLMAGADAIDVPYMAGWGLSRHYQFGWGAKSEVIFSSASNRDGYVSSQIVDDKNYSKAVIRTLALPTTDHVQIAEESEIPAAIEQIGFPCVVKPVDQASGKGISVGLQSAEQVRSAFHLAKNFTGKSIMLEQFVPGSDHRLMVADGQFIGGFRRDPPAVVGDGNRTIRELIEPLNENRTLPGMRSATQLVWIVLDDFVVQHLARQGVGPDTILEAGRKVTLRSTSNIATGGSCTDITAEVHPDIRAASEALARTMKIYMAGFDYITTDISRSWREVPGAFVELNVRPGLDAPTLAGWPPAKIGAIVIGKTAGRIPLDWIVLDESLLAEAEAYFTRYLDDQTAGWASHDKGRIGSLELIVKPVQPWSGIVALLSNAMVHRAYALLPSRHLQRFGFPVDRASRIWLCDDKLPTPWRDVLPKLSSGPVWEGDWRECSQLLGLA